MNELAFIRAQVATERRHMAAIRSALTAALAPIPDTTAASVRDSFFQVCADYLVYSVGRLNAQDQAHCDQLRPRVPRSDASAHGALEALQARLEQSRAAIGELSQALNARRSGSLDAAGLAAAAERYVAFYQAVLAPQRHRLSHLLDAHYRIEDWRSASWVDADSVLEERSRYAACIAQRPPGIDIPEAGDSDSDK